MYSNSKTLGKSLARDYAIILLHILLPPERKAIKNSELLNSYLETKITLAKWVSDQSFAFDNTSDTSMSKRASANFQHWYPQPLMIRPSSLIYNFGNLDVSFEFVWDIRIHGMYPGQCSNKTRCSIK